MTPEEEKVKYGLWEDGKRIEWFNEPDVNAINQRTLDYTQFFNQADSAEMVAPDATFRRPSGFDNKLSDINRKIETLRNKTQNRMTQGNPKGGMY